MKFRFVLGIAILASITQLGLAADRRIKDITDTATSAAADDYLIIDGTTNGTRNILTTKLPVSEAQQTALDAKASLTGTETLTNKTLEDANFTGTSAFDTLTVTTQNVTTLNVGGVSLAAYIATLIDTSAELAAILGDESGTGALIFANGNIGAATATTPPEGDNDGSVATTEFVQTEIAGLSSGSGIAAGMGLFWQTADLGSLSSDYFAAGLYGTGTGGTVGDWTLITKSLGTLATPTVSPAAGEIADGSTITFSSTDSGVTFRHTTSGTDPTYTTGTTGATTTLSGATTYEFIATKPGYPPSAVASVAYTVPSGAPTPDLLWWKLNHTSGTTITADVGPGSTTFTGSWITGASGSDNAAEMVAGSGDGNFQTSSTLAYGTNVISVSFWLRTASNTIGDIFKSIGVGGTNPSWAIYTANGPLAMYLTGSSGSRVETLSAPGHSTWRHYVVVFDNSTATGEITVYMNGVDQSLTLSTNTKSGTENFTTDEVQFKSPASSGAQFDVDDFRIYSGALSEAEAAAIYSGGAL